MGRALGLARHQIKYPLLGFDESRAVVMSVWGGVDDGFQEGGVFEKTLDRLDERVNSTHVRDEARSWVCER